MEKRFKIGDEVVALNNPKNNLCQPRIKGKTYTVNSVIYCSGCGIQCINLGLSLPDNFGSNFECPCGKTTPNLRLHWTYSKYFAKLNELKKDDLLEAKRNFANEHEKENDSAYEYGRDMYSFEMGAKWQSERMYSEEEVLELILKSKIETSNLYYEDMKEWFEQFKKK